MTTVANGITQDADSLPNKELTTKVNILLEKNNIEK